MLALVKINEPHDRQNLEDAIIDVLLQIDQEYYDVNAIDRPYESPYEHFKPLINTISKKYPNDDHENNDNFIKECLIGWCLQKNQCFTIDVKKLFDEDESPYALAVNITKS